ncbi:MAG: hypothetical protein QOK29_4241 [Rhodospirillaceae bacterium]|jgi:uncharacterized membrane protein HdeD (DUF308 family)|nr:hypothetical protein [Rhodospirillaceae bacterium]
MQQNYFSIQHPDGTPISDRGPKGERRDLAGQPVAHSAFQQGPRAGPVRPGMSAGLARNWWAIGLRGLAAILFGVAVSILPPSTVASVVLLFAAYIAADGIFAILAGARAAQRGERWWMLIGEGMVNLAVAAVLVWPAVIVVPFLDVASIWAIVTGGLMLAAAGRLSVPHGRWLLVLAGGASATWGTVAAIVGLYPVDERQAIKLWLTAYAVVFGGTLLALGFRLRRRHTSPGNGSSARG